MFDLRSLEHSTIIYESTVRNALSVICTHLYPTPRPGSIRRSARNRPRAVSVTDAAPRVCAQVVCDGSLRLPKRSSRVVPAAMPALMSFIHAGHDAGDHADDGRAETMPGCAEVAVVTGGEGDDASWR
eukprot:5984605-Pleurochrysis_carterae.AAC.1